MKRINKRIFFTLTLISSTFLPSLSINVKTTTNIPRVKIWTEDSGNISDGYLGFMFEDSRGNLWSVGNGTPLQKYDYSTSTWKTSPEISGNISDGYDAFMFQDKKGNLWSAGWGTALQKYDYAKESWETSEAIRGNLKDGTGGFMFEDSRGNLWSAGNLSALQKYDYSTHTWETSPKISGNISDGNGGFMFEDSKGYLWSAGWGTALQKYDYSTHTWETSPKIRGNLSNGTNGFMFKDRRGNLWSAGNGIALQKYDYGNNMWKISPAIRGNLNDGIGGFMFQDKKGNLWSVGFGTPLQKYDYSTHTWETSPKIRGNISDGIDGFMFEDSGGNLWSAGNGTALQKYDYSAHTWETSPKIRGNLSNGIGGFMFEDSKGYLWSVGHKSKLQVMYSDKDVASVIALIQANSGMAKIATNKILPILTSSNTQFDAVALNSLGTGGTFPGDTKGTTLTYAHGGTTNDGALDVTVTIAKGAATATATFTVSVTGINVAKKNKIQTNNLQALKMQLTGGNVINDANKVKVIVARINDAPSLKVETGIDLAKLATTSTYVISASGDKDTGVITISVIMTTNGATAPISNAVTHTINHKSDATINTEVQNSLDKVDVDNVKVLIEAISGVKKTSSVAISLVAANTPFDVAAFKALGGTNKIFPRITKGTILTYAHGGTTIDGTLVVTVTITKGTARETATFTVSVTGIDVAKQNKIQKTNLQVLKTRLTGGIVINDADKVGVIAARINDAPSLKAETGIDLSGLVNSSTYVISASGAKDTGVITISVIMTTNGATASKSPPVAHTINHKSDATINTEVQNSLDKVDVDNVKALIEAISGVKKTSSVDILVVAANTPFDVAAFKALGGTNKIFPSITKGTILTYAHGGITSDGTLVVTVTITKGTARETATFTVDVTGIDVAKQNEIQKTNLQALKMQLTGGAATNDANKAGVIAARINDAPSLKAETGIDLSGLVNSSTYVISASGDKDTGVITISVIMTTRGATVPKSVAVTHTINHKSDATINTEVQNSLDKVDVDNVKVLIEAISGVKKTSSVDILVVAANTPFDVAAFKALGGTDKIFPSITKGTILTYAHGGITSDGLLTVTVKIAKGKATAFANFNIAVSGIDLANAKAKVQKEVDKFKNFNSADSLNSAVAILPLNVENVKTQFEAITGYKVPSLTDGYSISKVSITGLDPKTRKIFYTIFVSDTNSNTATKDIVVTFAINPISKDKDLSKGVIAGITIGSILGVGILGFLIYYLFKKIKIKN